MALKDGDRYVSKTDGSEIKVVKAANGKWFQRYLSKGIRGSTCKFDESTLEQLVRKNYVKKETN